MLMFEYINPSNSIDTWICTYTYSGSSVNTNILSKKNYNIPDINRFAISIFSLYDYTSTLHI
jgi:hypothetical protein